MCILSSVVLTMTMKSTWKIMGKHMMMIWYMILTTTGNITNSTPLKASRISRGKDFHEVHHLMVIPQDGDRPGFAETLLMSLVILPDVVFAAVFTIGLRGVLMLNIKTIVHIEDLTENLIQDEGYIEGMDLQVGNIPMINSYD